MPINTVLLHPVGHFGPNLWAVPDRVIEAKAFSSMTHVRFGPAERDVCPIAQIRWVDPVSGLADVLVGRMIVPEQEGPVKTTICLLPRYELAVGLTYDDWPRVTAPKLLRPHDQIYFDRTRFTVVWIGDGQVLHVVRTENSQRNGAGITVTPVVTKSRK